MTKRINLFLVLCVFSQLDVLSQELLLEMGLDSGSFYMETTAMRNETSAMRLPSKDTTKYRFFKPDDLHEKVQYQLGLRHNSLWAGYSSSYETDERSREGYMKYARERDEYFITFANLLAPTLYFDFFGESGKEYILLYIIVKTIRYDEYRGGGFSNNEAWYDIELRSKKGTKRYPIDKKLRFTGSGRVELRFWNDKFYKSVGQSPIGNYFIELTFVYLSNSKKIKVKTEPFKLDV